MLALFVRRVNSLKLAVDLNSEESGMEGKHCENLYSDKEIKV